MKNLINYYYNLFIDKFKKVNDCFEFEIDNKNYSFIPFYGDTNSMYKNYLILKRNNKYCHEIILNKENSILTIYNNKPYILIKKNFCIDKYVNIDEILNYDIPILDQKKKIDWKDLWKEKVDYYEYQMSQLSFKYPMLKNSFNYYIGLTECAIELLNYIDDAKISYGISHKRIVYKEKLCDFFNPINIIIDSRTRDIAEYIKINYINENISIDEVYNLINYFNFDYYESILFLSRLLYPSYYFDLYDKVIQEKVREDKLSFYIQKNTAYEVFLKKIYMFLKMKYALPDVEWLNIKV